LHQRVEEAIFVSSYRYKTIKVGDLYLILDIYPEVLPPGYTNTNTLPVLTLTPTYTSVSDLPTLTPTIFPTFSSSVEESSSRIITTPVTTTPDRKCVAVN
jgi:hypothetical protein